MNLYARYRVGCAGQHAMGLLHTTTDDVNEAIASCATGPVGCEVYDSVTRTWIGPTCQEEIDDAKAALASDHRGVIRATASSPQAPPPASGEQQGPDAA